MTEREFDMNGSETLPLYTPETVREPKVETETDFGKTMPPDHASPKVDTWQHTTPVHEQKGKQQQLSGNGTAVSGADGRYTAGLGRRPF